MTEALPANEMRFRQIQDYIDRMPSLPATVTKVLEVCNRPDASTNDLKRVISLDPVLTGLVLKLINSAYDSLPDRITSITRAIIILGLYTVKNLVLNTAVLGTFKPESSHSDFLDGFWAHSICVAVTMKTLAEKLALPEEMHEEYFVAGLLHDLGRIPLHSLFPEEYGKVVERAAQKQESLEKIEKTTFGFDHGAVGGMIAEQWLLRDSIREVMTGAQGPGNIHEKNGQIIMMASLANMYANSMGFAAAGDLFREEAMLVDVLEAFGIAWEDLQTLEAPIRSAIDKEKSFLHISGERI